MDNTYLENLFNEHRSAGTCPSPSQVVAFFNRLLGFLFPQYNTMTYSTLDELKSHSTELQEELRHILSNCNECQTGDEEEIARQFWKELPNIKSALQYDITAMYEGDPAAKSRTEVIRTYPGFYAIASYRIAHFLHEKGYLLLSRMITENAHCQTGIDIHPGSRIGSYFCIDHGTGIVIGETTDIGDHVKIYQGVTLGALSVRKEDAAVKRHPTIEDHVVIYAGASILGGDTIVGRNSIIGGNVWLTESVPAWSRVSYVARLENQNVSDSEATN